MSESDAHRHIVATTARAIQDRWPGMRLTLDHAQAPGDEVPFFINGRRPDIFGLRTDAEICSLIAEIKTRNDVHNSHTRDQIIAFLQYLNDRTTGQGVFVFAVNNAIAHEARRFLQWTGSPYVGAHVKIMLFDGLDFWTLNLSGGIMWHLS